jgi:hypothetical protein
VSLTIRAIDFRSYFGSWTLVPRGFFILSWLACISALLYAHTVDSQMLGYISLQSTTSTYILAISIQTQEKEEDFIEMTSIIEFNDTFQ